MKYLVASDRVAIVYNEAYIHFNHLLQEVESYAGLYSDLDTQRVAIFSENRPEWIFCFYSAWFLKKTIVPIDYLSSPDEVDYILRDCRPGVIFCSKTQYEVILDTLKSLPYEIRVIIFEDITPCKSSDKNIEFPSIDPEATAMIIYTSGTTGSPKGVMLSFKNVNINIKGVAVTKVFSKETKALGLLPLHHTFPLIGTMVGPLAVQGMLVLCPSMASEDIMRTLQDHKVNTIVAVPRFYNLIRKGICDKINKSFIARQLFTLAKMVNSYKFSRKIFKKAHDKMGGSIRFMVCGGAALDYEVARDFKVLGFEMLEGYGMTETGPMISFTRPGRRKLGSPGEVLQGTEVDVKDGEIIVRGDNVMQGYFNRPEETAAVIRDGWLYTGDLGEIDDDGFIFIKGRRKEIIVLSNGKNINPAEVELALDTGSDYILEVGVYEDRNQLHAIIYPDFPNMKANDIHQLDEHFNGIIDRYNSKVSSYKRIISFTITKHELPKTRLSKLKRFMLKDIVQGTNELDPHREEESEPTTQTYAVIKAFLNQQTDQIVRPSDHIEIDLGLDSLDKVNFLTFLENTFGIDLEEKVFSQHATLKSLAHFISENKKRITEESVNWGNILREKLDLSLPKTWITHIWLKYICKFTFNIYFRFKSEGLHHIPDGPCIITPNHQSYFDGFFISSILKNFHLKKTYFYAKEKHLNKRWQKFLAPRHNVIVMDVNKDLKHSLQKMAAALKAGKNIIIFPEGTRTKDGSLGKFKKTFAILSRELNIPVVPVSIKGAFEALPTGGFFPKPRKKIVVKVSEPIYPENHTYESLQETVYQNVLKNIEEPAA